MEQEHVNIVPEDHAKFPRRFGPYVIVSFLGEGGMGSVYLAVMGSRESADLCVIKQAGSMWSQFTTDMLPEIEQRFRREAEITMALSHPAIPKTFALGSQPGPYFVQEYVNGVSLRQLVTSVSDAKETVPVPLASHIVAAVAEALSYLHDFEDRGLVHRDVTPDNVMLSVAGQVKLIDFGIVKPTALDEGLTKRGIVGKAEWLAPEVFESGKLDRRADIYALGLVYWYLLTRREHIDGDVRDEHRHLVAPSTLNPEIPAALDEVVHKALAANPDQRFQNAEEFRKAVAAFIPVGYAGPQELTRMVFRNTSRLADRFDARMLALGKGLLDEDPTAAPKRRAADKIADAKKASDPYAPTKVLSPPRRSRKRIAAVVVLLMAAGGIAAIALNRPQGPTPPAQTTFPPRPVPAPPPPSPPIVEHKPQPEAAPVVPAAPPVVHPVPAPVHKPTSPQAKPLPEKIEHQPSADELLASAMESFERSELTKALSQARQAAELGAGARAYLLIGSCLQMKKDYVGAEAALEQALRLSPNNVEAKQGLERMRQNGPSRGP